MDPHVENYYNKSPYSWVANNPINVIDPTGMDTVNYNNVDWKNFDTNVDLIGLDNVVVSARGFPDFRSINWDNLKSQMGWEPRGGLESQNAQSGGGSDFSLAGMYAHFQFGGGNSMTLNMSSVDFGGATQ